MPAVRAIPRRKADGFAGVDGSERTLEDMSSRRQDRRAARRIQACGALAVALALGAGGAVAPARAETGPAGADLVAAGLPLVALTPDAMDGPTPQGVTAALGRAMSPQVIDAQLGPETSKALTPNHAIAVADEADYLFQRNLDKPMIPGSIAKLVTAASVLNAVGTDTRLVTRASLQGDTIVLIGGGDPQLANHKSKKSNPLPDASLQQLAQATASALKHQPGAGAGAGTSYQVAFDASLFSGPTSVPMWAEDLQNRLIGPVSALTVDGGTRLEGEWRSASPEPAMDAARDFKKWLVTYGVPVAGSPGEARADAQATELARVSSQPMSVLVEHMLLTSDNIEAEMLGRIAGSVMAGDASFTGAQVAARQTLMKLGVPVSGLGLEDSSGMSKGNRLTPSLVMGLLAAVQNESQPFLWPIASGLPTGGFDGTLAPRFSKPATTPGRGLVRAKTGTLTGVSSLAGWIYSAGGQPLRFVMIINDSKVMGAAAIEDLASASLASCGCGGPGAPVARQNLPVPSASGSVDDRPDTTAPSAAESPVASGPANESTTAEQSVIPEAG